MSEILGFLVNQIGEAFNIMIEWEVLEGVNLLTFCIVLAVAFVLLDIVWINYRATYMFDLRDNLSRDRHPERYERYNRRR